jgi:hypothetical protein
LVSSPRVLAVWMNYHISEEIRVTVLQTANYLQGKTWGVELFYQKKLAARAMRNCPA